MSEQIGPHRDKEALPGICPVSGLPIFSKPEWTNVRCGENYEVTIRIVGDFHYLGAGVRNCGAFWM